VREARVEGPCRHHRVDLPPLAGETRRRQSERCTLPQVVRCLSVAEDRAQGNAVPDSRRSMDACRQHRLALPGVRARRLLRRAATRRAARLTLGTCEPTQSPIRRRRNADGPQRPPRRRSTEAPPPSARSRPLASSAMNWRCWRSTALRATISCSAPRRLLRPCRTLSSAHLAQCRQQSRPRAITNR
jgi:hypothetical protein